MTESEKNKKTALRTEALSAGYGDREVLKDLSFSVRPGEITALVGPNGAGKSTLLKTIARQLEPLRGTVFLGEEDLAGMKAQETARRMSVILTERPRAELMTCFDVAAMGRYPYTGNLGILSEEDRNKVLETMELVGVGELRDREIARVSDGQRQLVMLARAICQEPEVLVMDEPTSYLDIRHKIKFLTILKKLVRERGIAVLVSLHELELAVRTADTVICVRDGKADRTGDPKKILTEAYIEELYGMEPGSYSAFFQDGTDMDPSASQEACEARNPSPEQKAPAYQFLQNRACEYFPCHNGVAEEDFSCLFCYCPLYALGDRCGGNFRYTASGVKDCTNCNFPHRRENYRAVLKHYPEIAALAAIRSGDAGNRIIKQAPESTCESGGEGGSS